MKDSRLFMRRTLCLQKRMDNCNGSCVARYRLRRGFGCIICVHTQKYNVMTILSAIFKCKILCTTQLRLRKIKRLNNNRDLQIFSTNGLPDSPSTYGLVSSLWTSMFSLGSFLGPSLSGILYDAVGFSKGTLVVIVFSLIMV